jgi:hypothetical protein
MSACTNTRRRRREAGLCADCGLDAAGAYRCGACKKRGRVAYRVSARMDTDRTHDSGLGDEAIVRWRTMFAVGRDPSPEARWDESPVCHQHVDELGEMSLTEIAWVLGITKERARQLEVTGLMKFRRQLERLGLADEARAIVAEASRRGSVIHEPTRYEPSRMHFYAGH